MMEVRERGGRFIIWLILLTLAIAITLCIWCMKAKTKEFVDGTLVYEEYHDNYLCETE